MENTSDINSSAIVFGEMPNGEKVVLHRLISRNGIEMNIINLGAIITSIHIPAEGEKVDVVLGFDTVEDYIESQYLAAPPHFGAVIGRFAGRIKNGKFSVGEKNYQLYANNGLNTLHGGKKGWDKALWKFISATGNSVTLRYDSANGEENFPGAITVNVTYTLTDDNKIVIEYDAISTEDTIINMTQHTYFNLDGHNGNVLDQRLQINSGTILEIDAANIPSGKLIPASEKGFDFTQARNCPAQIDDSFVITDTTQPVAKLQSSSTGISMIISSDQPSLHIYVGGDLFGKLKGKDGADYHPHSGICFESQNYTDAPNHPNFPSAILKKGETYHQKTIWKFEFAKSDK